MSARANRSTTQRFAPLWLCLLLATLPAWAGRGCETRTLPPQELARAADSALRVAAALEAQPAEVALLARAGTDLSQHGMHYSHVGFVLRDHLRGGWTVVHLLNYCGRRDSALFEEGLFNFFADDLVTQDARIVWLQPELATRLVPLLRSNAVHNLHQPHYSLIARPGSASYQNSTAWVLELLIAAEYGAAIDRREVPAQLRDSGFEPDLVHIAYSKRIAGGLFADNLVFTDHSVGTRLRGDYPVVSVRSIFRYLERQQQIEHQREWRQGTESVRLGPA